MLKSGEMMLDTIIVTAGASNSWGGKTTPYDRENDYVSFPKTPQDTSNQLYTLNSELSKKRERKRLENSWVLRLPKEV